MSVTDQAKTYETSAAALGAWLRANGGESWWSIDGDPDLTGKMSFPSSTEDLAAALEERGDAVLLLSASSTLRAPVGPAEVEKAVMKDTAGNRVLQLSWPGGEAWLLIEDRETRAELKL